MSSDQITDPVLPILLPLDRFPGFSSAASSLNMSRQTSAEALASSNVSEVSTPSSTPLAPRTPVSATRDVSMFASADSVGHETPLFKLNDAVVKTQVSTALRVESRDDMSPSVVPSREIITTTNTLSNRDLSPHSAPRLQVTASRTPPSSMIPPRTPPRSPVTDAPPMRIGDSAETQTSNPRTTPPAQEEKRLYQTGGSLLTFVGKGSDSSASFSSYRSSSDDLSQQTPGLIVPPPSPASPLSSHKNASPEPTNGRDSSNNITASHDQFRPLSVDRNYSEGNVSIEISSASGTTLASSVKEPRNPPPSLQSSGSAEGSEPERKNSQSLSDSSAESVDQQHDQSHVTVLHSEVSSPPSLGHPPSLSTLTSSRNGASFSIDSIVVDSHEGSNASFHISRLTPASLHHPSNHDVFPPLAPREELDNVSVPVTASNGLSALASDSMMPVVVQDSELVTEALTENDGNDRKAVEEQQRQRTGKEREREEERKRLSGDVFGESVLSSSNSSQSNLIETRPPSVTVPNSDYFPSRSEGGTTRTTLSTDISQPSVSTGGSGISPLVYTPYSESSTSNGSSETDKQTTQGKSRGVQQPIQMFFKPVSRRKKDDSDSAPSTSAEAQLPATNQSKLSEEVKPHAGSLASIGHGGSTAERKSSYNHCPAGESHSSTLPGSESPAITSTAPLASVGSLTVVSMGPDGTPVSRVVPLLRLSSASSESVSADTPTVRQEPPHAALSVVVPATDVLVTNSLSSNDSTSGRLTDSSATSYAATTVSNLTERHSLTSLHSSSTHTLISASSPALPPQPQPTQETSSPSLPAKPVEVQPPTIAGSASREDAFWAEHERAIAEDLRSGPLSPRALSLRYQASQPVPQSPLVVTTLPMTSGRNTMERGVGSTSPVNTRTPTPPVVVPESPSVRMAAHIEQQRALQEQQRQQEMAELRDQLQMIQMQLQAARMQAEIHQLTQQQQQRSPKRSPKNIPLRLMVAASSHHHNNIPTSGSDDIIDVSDTEEEEGPSSPLISPNASMAGLRPSDTALDFGHRIAALPATPNHPVSVSALPPSPVTSSAKPTVAPVVVQPTPRTVPIEPTRDRSSSQTSDNREPSVHTVNVLSRAEILHTTSSPMTSPVATTQIYSGTSTSHSETSPSPRVVSRRTPQPHSPFSSLEHYSELHADTPRALPSPVSPTLPRSVNSAGRPPVALAQTTVSDNMPPYLDLSPMAAELTRIADVAKVVTKSAKMLQSSVLAGVTRPIVTNPVPESEPPILVVPDTVRPYEDSRSLPAQLEQLINQATYDEERRREERSQELRERDARLFASPAKLQAPPTILRTPDVRSSSPMVTVGVSSPSSQSYAAAQVGKLWPELSTPARMALVNQGMFPVLPSAVTGALQSTSSSPSSMRPVPSFTPRSSTPSTSRSNTPFSSSQSVPSPSSQSAVAQTAHKAYHEMDQASPMLTRNSGALVTRWERMKSELAEETTSSHPHQRLSHMQTTTVTQPASPASPAPPTSQRPFSASSPRSQPLTPYSVRLDASPVPNTRRSLDFSPHRRREEHEQMDFHTVHAAGSPVTPHEEAYRSRSSSRVSEHSRLTESASAGRNSYRRRVFQALSDGGSRSAEAPPSPERSDMMSGFMASLHSRQVYPTLDHWDNYPNTTQKHSQPAQASIPRSPVAPSSMPPHLEGPRMIPDSNWLDFSSDPPLSPQQVSARAHIPVPPVQSHSWHEQQPSGPSSVLFRQRQMQLRNETEEDRQQALDTAKVYTRIFGERTRDSVSSGVSTPHSPVSSSAAARRPSSAYSERSNGSASWHNVQSHQQLYQPPQPQTQQQQQQRQSYSSPSTPQTSSYQQSALLSPQQPPQYPYQGTISSVAAPRSPVLALSPTPSVRLSNAPPLPRGVPGLAWKPHKPT